MTASPSPPSPGPMHVLIGEGLQVLTCPSTTQASLVRPPLEDVRARPEPARH